VIGQIGSSGNTVLDFAPLVVDAAQILAWIVLSVLGWWLQGHVRNENARKAILDAAANGVYHAVNRITAAGPNMKVSVASGVSAMAAKYVIGMVPDAAKRLGLTDRKIVDLVVSRLPGVDGALDEKTMDFIASHLGGGSPPPAIDMNALAEAAKPILEQLARDALSAVYDKPTKVAADKDPPSPP
jgi:hypothetical protein